MKSDSKITIAIYLCILCNINLKISTVLQYVRFHGLLVTTFAFWLEGHEFESHPGQAFFYFFLSKWDKKWRNMWASEGVRTKLGLFNFNRWAPLYNICINLMKLQACQSSSHFYKAAIAFCFHLFFVVCVQILRTIDGKLKFGSVLLVLTSHYLDCQK